MLLKAENLTKTFFLGGEKIEVLKNLSLFVDEGDFIAIMGTSGSGKSTLLHILGGLLRPDSGGYVLQKKDMLELSDDEQAMVRGRSIGLVFQTFNLLHELDVFQNIALPFQYQLCDRKDIETKVLYAIEQVGLAKRIKHRPAELSGGEIQRVAIARALVAGPLLLLADEPTGNLDSKNSSEILRIFQELNRLGKTIIMVTHDSNVASIARKVLLMQNGILSQI